MSLVVRLQHPSGRARLSVAATASFQNFQEQVQEITGIAVFGQTLSFDESGRHRLVGRPHASVETVGLTNGCVVWVRGSVVVIDHDPEPEPARAAVPAAVPVPVPAATAAAAAGPAGETGSGPKHATFEAFLRTRRFETGTLSGSLSYRAVKRPAQGLMTRMPPTVTLTHQPYRHVDHVEFMNVPEIRNFVEYWQRSLHCVTQRSGWLYGYYVEDTKTYDEGWRAVVEGVYEPPEEEDGAAELEMVDKLMERLGLERVGYIWTSISQRKSLVTSKEIVQQTKRQLERATDEHYTGYRVSKQVGVVVRLDASTGQAEPEAVMASDQAMAMVRDDLVREEDQSEENVKVRAGDEKEELLPTVLQEYKEVKDFDADWLVVKVNHSAPVKPRSFFKFSHFPREHRGELTGAASYFAKIPKDTPNWQQFSDFHLLVFIARIIDVDTALAIATAVRDKQQVAAGFVELVKAATSQF